MFSSTDVVLKIVIYVLCVGLAFGLANIAIGKDAMRSSKKVGPGCKFIEDCYAEEAVDGNYNEFYNTNFMSCSATSISSDTFEWWAVYLNDIYAISNIVVHGVTCCYEDLTEVAIDVIQSDAACNTWSNFPVGSRKECYFQSEPTTYINATCPANAIGNFVRLQKRAYNVSLILCEVEVYGQVTSAVSERIRILHPQSNDGIVYNKVVINIITVQNRLQCILSCRNTKHCCIAEIRKSTNQCILKSNADLKPVKDPYLDVESISFLM